MKLKPLRTIPVRVGEGRMKLSIIIQQVPVGKLKLNEKNRQYFTGEDNGHDITALEKDIKTRGIQVPLVAKSDGVLLAGHRRLLIARKLGIKKVPVQYMHGKMTTAQEVEYLIKDNLLRRQLLPAEREALYRAIYKDFDERILMKGSSMSITSGDVAKKTGLNQKTVNWDLNMMRHKRKKELRQAAAVDVINDKAIERYKKAVARMLNDAQVESETTVEEFTKLTFMANDRLENMKLMRRKPPIKLT